MEQRQHFRFGRTALWDLAFGRWVAQTTVASGGVREWYPSEVGGLPAEPSLEERIDAWLERHQEAMKRLADL